MGLAPLQLKSSPISPILKQFFLRHMASIKLNLTIKRETFPNLIPCNWHLLKAKDSHILCFSLWQLLLKKKKKIPLKRISLYSNFKIFLSRLMNIFLAAKTYDIMIWLEIQGSRRNWRGASSISCSFPSF